MPGRHHQSVVWVVQIGTAWRGTIRVQGFRQQLRQLWQLVEKCREATKSESRSDTC